MLINLIIKKLNYYTNYPLFSPSLDVDKTTFIRPRSLEKVDNYLKEVMHEVD